MNTKLKKRVKKRFWKRLINKKKLMNKAVFKKSLENMKKHRNIKPVTTEKRKKYLVSKQNYHKTNFFSENLLAIKMFWYDYDMYDILISFDMIM